MARPKEFDRDAALDKAMHQFWAHGYAATSTDDLLVAMGIGRQSLYDTFGDKQQLYMEALRRYHAGNVRNVPSDVAAPATARDTIRDTLLSVVERAASARAIGCMGINATTAAAGTVAEVTALARGTACTIEGAFTNVIEWGIERGEFAAETDAAATASFLYVTLQGLTVRAQAGASPAALRAAVGVALNALKP